MRAVGERSAGQPQASGERSEEQQAGEAIAPQAPEWQGSVLITGGTGALGALLARHLVVELRGAQLVLASRRGVRRRREERLQAELSDLGAQVTIAACDVADREQLLAAAELGLAGAPAERGGARCGRPRRRRDRLADAGARRPGARAEGRRGVAPARADRAARPVRVRPVLFGPASSAARARATTPRRTRSWTPWRPTATPGACPRPRWRGGGGRRRMAWRAT